MQALYYTIGCVLVINFNSKNGCNVVHFTTDHHNHFNSIIPLILKILKLTTNRTSF